MSEKISFLELAKRVIKLEKVPMTAERIWQTASEQNLVVLLKSTGKTPEATIGSALYSDARKQDSDFTKVGSRPVKFFLKELSSQISEDELEKTAELLNKPDKSSSYRERELHPLLVEFADRKFNAICRTIYHEKSRKKGDKHNQWIHPDIVGFSLISQEWKEPVVKLAKTTSFLMAKLFSFELKISIDFTFLREYFFQAVSNSSWAHEGYLVAAEIDENQEFRDELSRLSQSFGIGVIQLDVKEPFDSKVLYPARERNEIDLETVNRITGVNPDFKEFIVSVVDSININKPQFHGFDEILKDEKLLDQLKKLTK
jgi:hypothetical protein